MLAPEKTISQSLWVLAPALYNPDDPRVANLARLQLDFVKRGFHVVALDPGNTPESLHAWDEVYDEMNSKYRLFITVTLMGSGTESPVVAQWAANSGKSQCLYLDHPVFAEKSASASSVKPPGISETPALLAKKLVARNIALIEVGEFGADSSTAGSDPLAQEVGKLGGILKLISSAKTSEAPFGLEDPAPLIDFIRYHSLGLPESTYKAVSYGPHSEQVIEFWKAPSDKPTPLVVYIHGGGWIYGCYVDNHNNYVEDYLKEGVSVASIEYRFTPANPLPAPVHDAARALQFIRSKAAEWNLDPSRVIVTGVSAGGCAALWLATHDDLADPKSKDPVERQSTRVSGAMVDVPQTTIEPDHVRDWVGPAALSHQMICKAGGFMSNEEMFKAIKERPEIDALYHEFSPINHLSPDDPPMLLSYGPNAWKQPDIHGGAFGLKFKEKADALGMKNVALEVVNDPLYPGFPGGSMGFVNSIFKLKTPDTKDTKALKP